MESEGSFSKGAMGLMQLMPATAQRFGAFDPFKVNRTSPQALVT